MQLRLKIKRGWAAATILSSLIIGGCGPLPLPRNVSFAGGAGINAARSTAAQKIARTSPANLTPLSSGFGLIVFEPEMPIAADISRAPAMYFAAGCGRWLHLNASGQGALGKTPSWGAVEYARRATSAKSLRLGAIEASKVAQMSGATHFACGSFSGEPQSTLSYQIYDVATHRLLGAPIAATGDRARIILSLPQMARQMGARLKIAAPVLPARCELDDKALSLVGRVAWEPQRVLSMQDNLALEKLAPRSSLAALLWMRGAKLKPSQWPVAIARQIKLAPFNTLALCDVCRMDIADTTPQRVLFDALDKRYPNNYLLQSAGVWWCRFKGNRGGEVAHAQNAVRCATDNWLAWHQLSSTLFNVSEDVRQSRFSAQISGAEQGFLDAVYADSLDCAQRAVQLAPTDSRPYSRVAEAATFAGDMNLADRALWQALSIDPADADAYNWGFQFYQPKWHPNPAKLLKLAKTAAANADKFFVPADDMVSALHETRQQSAKEPILAQCVRLDPKNAQSLYQYGACLHYDRRSYRRAEKFYRAALALAPNYSRPTGSLADLTYFVHNDVRGADALYRRAIALDPQTAYHYEDYARFLALTKRRPLAMKVIVNAQRLGGSPDHPVWQELGVRP